MDERLLYIINNINVLCQIEDEDKLKKEILKCKDVTYFLDDLSLKTLHIKIKNDGSIDVINISSNSNGNDDNRLGVVFLKRRPGPITSNNISKNLDIHTLQGSPLEELYHSLHTIWCPSLTNTSSNYPTNVTNLLVDLESALRSSLPNVDDTYKLSQDDDIENISGIIEPIDEINFWKKIKDNRRSKYNNLARDVGQALSKIDNPGFMDIDSLDFSSLKDLIDKTLDALNEAWIACGHDEPPYPQKRMKHFMDCIGFALCRYIQRKLSEVDLWRGRAIDVASSLTAASGLCEQWVEIPKKLTTTFWPGSVNKWKGAAHNDSFCTSFKTRLDEVSRIRTLAEELLSLLSQEERASFKWDTLFAPLEEINPLMYNPYTEPQWQRAVKEYEKAVDPIEAAVATQFRRNISSIVDRPQLMLAEFKKFKSLLERPSMRRLLVSERETLLSLLIAWIKRMETAADNIDSNDETGSINNMSPRVGGIISLRQMRTKASSMLNTSQQLLMDLDDFSKFVMQCESFIARVQGEENNLFTSWLSDIKNKIEDDDESLQLKGSLMGWRDGLLVVNFSEDLVRFLREVRQLDELGFDIPKARKGKIGITDKALDAEKFYRYGILLKKTANFYNSLSEQMIDVQEQLLLDSLSAFVSIVSDQKENSKDGDVSWSNPADCENYIITLQGAAEKLASENRWLRKVHEFLCEQTVALMNIDLMKQTDLWKTKWRTIKDKMALVRNKYSEKDSRSWILHWDNQIYKALESSYQMGLASLNENLPEIKIEMVFTDTRLQFNPSLENVRQSYYYEMKKFAAIPINFEGFGNANVHKKMGSKNASRLVQVYEKAEELFNKLTNLLSRYGDWVKLGQIDLDQYIEENIKTAEEFLTNFKNIRNKRKEMDKLPDFEKIDCCRISLTPFKVFLEDLYHRFTDALLLALKKNIITNFDVVDNYLSSASKRLNTKPHSVEEIGEAKKQWKEIDVKKDTMKSLSKSCVEKKKILQQHAPGSIIDTSEVSKKMKNLDGDGGRWEDFDIALEAFNDMIEEQKEQLKVTLEEDVLTLNMNIDKFANKWNQLKPGDVKSWDYDEVQKVFDALQDWKVQFSELQSSATRLVDNCLTFNMNRPRFDGLDSLQDDIDKLNKSWDMLKDFNKEIQEIGSQDWMTFSTNVYVLQDFASKWSETLKVTFAKGSYDNVVDHIINTVERLKKSVPALKYCRGETFKDDHWIELLQGKLQLSREVNRNNIKVDHFISRLEILMEPSTLSFVKNLQARALGEVQIREALQELKAWEISAEIKFLTPSESGRRVPLIKDWKDLFLEMGDKQSLLASLKESQFFKAFADLGNALEAKITILDFVLQTLNSIQRKWVYLEPIFGRGALPSEESRFKRIDEDFTRIMKTASKNTKLFSFADSSLFPQICDDLTSMSDQLEKCQKALSDFLEEKRSVMPRFYFIGDDDLLEILGQAKNPEVIQSHLKKLFQGIHKVKFDADCKKIVSMISSSNEVVDLENPVPVSEKVEDWLHLLATEMRSTLASLLVQCLNSPTFSWKYPSQILCLAESIKFTDSTETAIEEGPKAIDSLHKQITKTLREYTSHDLSGEPLIQLKMKSLVMDIVHNIDVLEQLQKAKTTSTSQWQWKKQLRYYLEQGKAVIRMHDAKFEYSYEYQGNAPKLVHTPLTDKCYLTLTQGMHMGFGGNPYGPAGTGKTESVKALASCFGRQVLVFNCDEAVDSTSMIRIFIGIVKCGAWGCFDEFNRLKEDQLSAISQQIQIIQDAIKMRTSPIPLLGRSIDVNFNSGIFVTLNPAGKGYGGRSRLPDNLKALFRPVAMGAPDNELIAEVSLVTEGFIQAKDLASKIVSLFKLSRQLLSAQQHYDWGLRALKAVLNSGGRLIQNYKAQGAKVDSTMEYEILIKAVRVNTLSKLTFTDTSKFLALIGDVFPGVTSSDISGGELEEAIKIISKEKPFFLVEDPLQIKKMIQLKESLDQRMGCVIVGPSGCGKSSLWRVLKAAMIKCGQPVVTYVMNPKSMPRERLLGHMDMDTREWSDGVLTDAARKVVRESPDVRCWIICDGDVDPEWIESLNSVLDDNHLLTLPNGERINFGPNVNFLFETHDLKFASPATVSRMGMIFLSDEDFDVSHLVQRWLSTFPQEKRLTMSSWMDELFYKALAFVLRSDLVVETTLVGTVMNGLSQVKDANSRQEFICAVVRGLGGNLSIAQRILLAKEMFQVSGDRPAEMGSPLDCYADGGSYCSFPVAGLTREQSYIDVKDIGENTVVNTISVLRTMKVLESWVNNVEPFILVGPEGCGKSMIINHAFKQKRNIGIATINCNAQTTADDVISKIAQTCALFSSPDGRVYRPKDCDRLVLYLKDINLPRPDMYETCQLIAFLQQLITFDGFYNDELEFLKIERIQIVASINAATTVGRHHLSTRFTAVVRICVVDYPETAELVSVYDAFLAAVLGTVELQDKRWLQPSERERLASSIVDIYQKVREKFTVDDRRHYLFTPRDITTLVKNICRYSLSTDDLIDAISNETCRIFRDRLVGSDAHNRFDQILSSILRSQFRYNMNTSESYFTSITSARGGSSSSDKKDKDGGLVLGGRLPRMSDEDFKKLVSQGLLYYEREERELNLLLFQESLEHIARVDRVLSSFAGHLLLVGKTGVGRRNAVTLATYMLGYEFNTPLISRDYGAKQFIAYIKPLLITAGIKGEHVVLLIEDFQITSDSILEILNSLLSSGEATGVFANEEIEPLLTPIREMMREEGGYRTPYDFFVSRVKKYLHIVLCMDPGHHRFLYRCESNPALYSKCAVIWMGEWRSSTLKVIPTLMEGVKELVGCNADDENDDDDDNYNKHGDGKRGEGKHGESKNSKNRNSLLKKKITKAEGDALIETILSIHASSAAYGATPKDYIVFLKTWHTLYDTKRAEVLRELGHLEAGLSKLDTATEVVSDLRTNAVTQEKELRVAQAAADRAMDEISKALAGASDRRQEVGDIKRTVADNESKTQERKREIEGELAEVQPLLEEAKTAVGSIRSDHLNELKSLASPPEAVADVLAGVLMLLGMSDLSWASMKKFLSNRGVKDDILNYDGSKIDDDLRKKVSKLIKSKSNSYEADTIKRASVAAAPLAVWVKANIKYSLVMEKIQPLTDQLNEEISKLEESQKLLRRCEQDLEEIDDRVAELKREFASRTAEAERLKRNLEMAATTLDKAEGLIGQLGGEQARWKAQAAQLQADLSKLPSKVLLAAGFATYLAKTPEDVRASTIATWQDITDIRDFSFRRVMSTESELLQWKTMGLSADSLSQENSLVINYASIRVPFIIDPASAATEWLKSILSKDKTRPLEVVTHHDSRFCNQVELAVRFGKTLLILEADGLEPVLYPLCRNDLMHQGARYVVSVGDKVVDYNENFRMLLVTRNPNPDLPPDAAALVSEVNFTVTKGGLEGQLLGVAIQHEQPELEKAKGEMLRQEEDFKVQLAGLEKGLLEALATAEGNLLENTSLIESLTRTKETSAQIEDSLVKSAEMSKKLDEQREVYRPFALAGSKIYFLVKALQVISNMYQFSLASFLSLFNASLGAEMNFRTIDDRLALLCSDLEVRVLHFVGRALFKTDRPMFALHLVKGMHPDHFQPKEFEIFTGALVASVAEGIPRGFPSWAPSDRQGAYRLLTEHLPHLINSLELENVSKWHRFASSAEAEKDIPALRGVSPFQRVLIVQAFRPDRLQSALLQFCNDMLRVDSISPPPLSLSTLLMESLYSSPILLISSPGADASKELQEFALKSVGVGGYEELAMGGGQLQLAIDMIRSTASRGGWLCLKNLHLVVAWLPTLEKELSTLKAKPEFRLWLTSESHSAFPSILLQESLKATYEAPPGIKKNLQRAFESWDPEAFDSSNPTQSRLLFLLACFHAVIQERRNYIPQGWTKFYEFSYGDMRAGTFVMEACARSTSVKNPQLDWEAIYGLMEDAIYGGRIDNSYDLRVLRAYLKMFFSEQLVSEKGIGLELLPNTPLRMPSTPSYDNLKKTINQLSDIDAPYFFCLPDNIERTLQRVTSSAVIKQLRSLSALDAEAMKYDREKWKIQLGPLLEQWQEMTSSTAGLLSKRRDVSVTNTSGATKVALHDPVDDFVNMECDLAGELCTLVDGAMVAMKKILFGSGLLTPNIQAIATAILSDTVPNEWTQRWDGGPDKPQAWLRELIRKRISLMKLKSLAQKGQILNGDPLMLGDFFHPGIFANALRQQTSRQLGIAMERTKMISSWEKDASELKKICPLPCFLSGLLLQGATFHGGLQESSNDANELTPIPNVCIGFIGDNEKEPYSKSDMVGVPLYFTPSREEFLMELKMPSDKDADKWILAGCALFLTPE